MQKSKSAFTMIELVFVIVVLGILAAVAVPRFAATRTDAEITKGRADIAAIRSAIVTERQGRLITGDSAWIAKLSNSTTTLFTGVDANQTLLMYGIAAGTGSGHWQGNANGLDYTFNVQGTDVAFTYNPNTGAFTCNTANATCKLLTD
ncbi:type II secretion system protein [Sulfurimonas sp.]|uniref:type II secretion system protein n=1 Tax=Sulfurimonas sp. TaxID=2022749 RepID=UPI00262DD001|nr:type II secretion system protein [Sulfurimonas sp.]MCW8894709.1 type II secretion system GspH family protein [Sulfurimonas sp.]